MKTTNADMYVIVRLVMIVSARTSLYCHA